MPKGVVNCGNCVDDTRRLFGKTFSEIDTNNDDFMERDEIETAADTWPLPSPVPPPYEFLSNATAEYLSTIAMNILDADEPELDTIGDGKISQEEWENYQPAHKPPFITVPADDESQAEITE